jgi:hypothetical protein
MIDLLKTISKDVNAHLWMCESMGLNPLHLLRAPEHEHALLEDIGRTYLMKRHLEESIESLERIRKYCLSEINGTFYNDFEKQWEGNAEIEPKYTVDTPYEYILATWENYPNPEIGIELIAFVECSVSMSIGLTKCLIDFFPEAGPYRENNEGKMEKVSLSDIQIDDNLKAGSMLSDIEEYNERLAKIKQIAIDRGNLGNIITLIGNN